MPRHVALRVVGDTMSEMVNLSPDLHEAMDSLIQNLLASKPFLLYQQSQTRLEANNQARSLLEQLSMLQSHLRQKQVDGGVSQAEIEELRDLQAQVQANAAIMAYVQSQLEAVNFLREINQEISQLLGVDFALLARATTC